MDVCWSWGGQGWASCVFKRLYPAARVVSTDISEYAVQSAARWERMLDVRLEGAYACRAYETREADASVDLVFTFAAAHHFLRHQSTLQEIARILKPGGRALYLYEPTTPQVLYRPAVWRVNRNRPEVPEDVLVPGKLVGIAGDVGLRAQIDYYPSVLKRGPTETMYYSVLRRLTFLQRMLPCTGHFVFDKPR